MGEVELQAAAGSLFNGEEPTSEVIPLTYWVFTEAKPHSADSMLIIFLFLQP